MILSHLARDGSAWPGIGAFLKSRRQAIDRSAKALGPVLRFSHRVGKAVTQEEMAEALEVSRQWYASLEADAAHASVALINRISGVLSLSREEHIELLRLAVPAFAAAVPRDHSEPRVLESPSLPSVTGLELIISSTTEIETTARRLHRLREQFLTSDAVTSDLPRARILRSWTRSQAAHVDPARRAAPFAINRDVELFELRERNEGLLRAAQPVLSYLANELAGSGYAVIVTDRDGCILQLEGDLEIRRRLAKVELQPGGHWSEAAAGTNAIGTALSDGRPIQLMAAEHFCEGWQGLTCTAAPIRDPQTFEIVGALDITGSYKLIRAHLLALIMQCALEIEEVLALIAGKAPSFIAST